LFKQTVNISKENIENYNLEMFTHAMNFFKEWASLKKPILEFFFTSLLSDLLTKDLITFGQLVINKIHETQKIMQLQVSELGCHKN
jgi:hypothetical protein